MSWRSCWEEAAVHELNCLVRAAIDIIIALDDDGRSTGWGGLVQQQQATLYGTIW